MFNGNRYACLVAHGVHLLDRFEPCWFQQINVPLLNHRSVMSQLFGNLFGGAPLFGLRMDNSSPRQIQDTGSLFGFCSAYNDESFDPELCEAWVDAIEQKRLALHSVPVSSN